MLKRTFFLFFRKKINIIISVVIFILTFSIYSLTLLPSVGMGDVAKFQFITSGMSIPHTTGYPLYILIAKLFSFLPIGSLAYRINLMSAFFASLTGIVMYLICMKITKKIFISFLSALVFCFSLTLWSQAVITEVYTLNIFFIAIIVLFLLEFLETKKPVSMFIAIIFLALGLGNHLLIISVIPAILVTILFTDLRFFKNIKNITFAILPFMLTIGLYCYQYFRALSHPIYNEGNIDSFSSLIWYMTGGIFKGHFFRFGITELFSRFLMFQNILFNQFTIPVIILGTAGLVFLLIRKTKIFIILISILLSNLIVMINYDIFDIDVYIIPSTFIFSIFFSYSILFFYELIRRKFIKLKNHRPALLRFLIILIILIISFSSLYNSYENFKINDKSKNFDHYLRSKNIVSKLESNAVIIPEDYFVSMTLLYYIWVEHEENTMIIPFSFIANPYYVDLEYLEDELGLKREPFRMKMEEINKYKEENNIFLEDLSEIIKRRPVYILQTNPIIEEKMILKEITRQRFNFKELLINIPENNHMIILFKDLDLNKNQELLDSLKEIGFEDIDTGSFDSGQLMVITDKNKVFKLKELKKDKINDLNSIAKYAGLSLRSNVEIKLNNDFLLTINNCDYRIKKPVVVLNLDNNFNIFNIFEFDNFQDIAEIPYSYSNPQIFKIQSIK